MAQNTRWPDDSMRPSDTMRPSGNSGGTILAVIAVIILAGLVYLAAHGLGPTTTGDSTAPAVSTTSPSVVAPNPAAPAAPTAPTPPAATDTPAPTNP